MSNASIQDPYNRGGLWAFIFCMAFSFLFFIWVGILHPGVDLKEIPRATEDGTGPALAGQPQAPKFDPTKITDPWQSSEALVAHGGSVYQSNCAVCHGPKGMGDGPAGKAIGARDLVVGEWKVGGDRISLFKTVSGGIPGTPMVGFSQLSKVDRWALVHFIHSITKNKTKDDDKAVEKFAATAE